MTMTEVVVLLLDRRRSGRRRTPTNMRQPIPLSHHQQPAGGVRIAYYRYDCAYAVALLLLLLLLHLTTAAPTTTTTGATTPTFASTTNTATSSITAAAAAARIPRGGDHSFLEKSIPPLRMGSAASTTIATAATSSITSSITDGNGETSERSLLLLLQQQQQRGQLSSSSSTSAVAAAAAVPIPIVEAVAAAAAVDNNNNNMYAAAGTVPVETKKKQLLQQQKMIPDHQRHLQRRKVQQQHHQQQQLTVQQQTQTRQWRKEEEEVGGAVQHRSVLVIRILDAPEDALTATSTNSKLFTVLFQGLPASDNDPVELPSVQKQMSACSAGRVLLEPASDGILSVQVANTGQGSDRDAWIEAAATVLVQNGQFGTGTDDSAAATTDNTSLLQQQADHIVIVLPASYPHDDSFLATAAVGGPVSIYTVEWATSLSALMHELAHNLGLRHATSDTSNDEYGDSTGYMGRSGPAAWLPRKCYNAAQHWALGWYSSSSSSLRLSLVDPPMTSQLPLQITVAAFVDHEKISTTTNSKMVVLVQLTNNTFLQFNRAKDYNEGTEMMRDQVVIVRDEGTNTRLLAGLDATEGNNFYQGGGGGDAALSVRVCEMVMMDPAASSSSSSSTQIDYAVIVVGDGALCDSSPEYEALAPPVFGNAPPTTTTTATSAPTATPAVATILTQAPTTLRPATPNTKRPAPPVVVETTATPTERPVMMTPAPSPTKTTAVPTERPVTTTTAAPTLARATRPLIHNYTPAPSIPPTRVPAPKPTTAQPTYGLRWSTLTAPPTTTTTTTTAGRTGGPTPPPGAAAAPSVGGGVAPPLPTTTAPGRPPTTTAAVAGNGNDSNNINNSESSRRRDAYLLPTLYSVGGVLVVAVLAVAALLAHRRSRRFDHPDAFWQRLRGKHDHTARTSASPMQGDEEEEDDMERHEWRRAAVVDADKEVSTNGIWSPWSEMYDVPSDEEDSLSVVLEKEIWKERVQEILQQCGLVTTITDGSQKVPRRR